MPTDNRKPSNKKAPKTTLHVLIQDVSVGGELQKKGTKYPLTEQGVEFFKSKKYIH